MAAQIAVHGRLGGSPREITTRTGTTMAVCDIAVAIDMRDGEQFTEWFSIIAFSKLADILLKHQQGDLLSTAGRVQVSTWETNGEERRQFQIVADSLVSARTVRPGGGRKKQAVQNNGGDFQEPAGFDDEIAF